MIFGLVLVVVVSAPPGLVVVFAFTLGSLAVAMGGSKRVGCIGTMELSTRLLSRREHKYLSRSAANYRGEVRNNESAILQEVVADKRSIQQCWQFSQLA